MTTDDRPIRIPGSVTFEFPLPPATIRLLFTVGRPRDEAFPTQPRTVVEPEVGGSPIRADFPDDRAGGRQYEHAWHTWQWQNRDCHPTRAERAARATVLAELFDVPPEVADTLDVRGLRILATSDHRDMIVAAFLDAARRR